MTRFVSAGSVLAAFTLGIGVLLPTTTAQAATPAETIEVGPSIQAIDDDQGLLLFVNSTRADYCTPTMVAWEEAVLAWLETDMSTEPPPYPGYDSLETFSATRMPVGRHNAWSRWSAQVTVELWEFDEGVFPDHLGAGPCTDSDEATGPFATGIGTWTQSDNDSWGDPPEPGPRTNAIKDTIQAELSGPGGDYAYTATIHTVIRDVLTDFRFLHGDWRSTLTPLG